MQSLWISDLLKHTVGDLVSPAFLKSSSDLVNKKLCAIYKHH